MGKGGGGKKNKITVETDIKNNYPTQQSCSNNRRLLKDSGSQILFIQLLSSWRTGIGARTLCSVIYGIISPSSSISLSTSVSPKVPALVIYNMHLSNLPSICLFTYICVLENQCCFQFVCCIFMKHIWSKSSAFPNFYFPTQQYVSRIHLFFCYMKIKLIPSDYCLNTFFVQSPSDKLSSNSLSTQTRMQ